MTDDDLALEMLLAMMDAQEAGIAAARQILKEKKGLQQSKGSKATVQETILTILKFEDQEGAKIGSYAVAYEKNNDPEKFKTAYDILQQSNATINARYYGSEYESTYWLFGLGKIYRQKRART